MEQGETFDFRKASKLMPLSLALRIVAREEIEVCLSQAQLTDNTAHEACLALATRWLHNCLEAGDGSRHSCCNRRPGYGEVQLPSRLIYCGNSENSNAAKLCSKEDVLPDTNYLTFSHSWGREVVFSLEKDNLASLRTEIPLDRLSRTFQDAITVTKRLGFEYIWIDSLCIIQDSHDDWVIEGSRMSEVYSNATLNIAATGFADGKRGFLASRDPALALPHQVTLEVDSPWFRALGGSEHYICSVFWDGEVENAPLNRRGWVRQERLLSPRTLHFGRNQLYWECSGLAASEMFPTGFVAGFNIKPKSAQLFPWRARTLEEEHPCVVWERLVPVYSRARLSFESDKLVAISGIARVVQESLRDQSLATDYLAGLWKDSLLQELLWYVPVGNEPTRIPVKSRAPTWSWASLDAEINFVIEAETVPIVSDLFGSATGHIRLKGPLKKIRDFFKVDDETGLLSIPCDGLDSSLDLFPDITQDPFSEQRCPFSIHTPGSNSDDRTGCTAHPSEFLYLMPIISPDTEHLGQGITITGLALSRTCGTKGEFYRQGLFYIYAKRDNALDIKELFKLGGDVNEDDVNEDDVEIYHGPMEYTIKIV
ncbi:hypothetical protein EG329_008226 [Mollisiaceae sp. DMI_Dod_QoI]|nr:hypothetical protein EG329_008226 [Helotiales sp. DMI_Dod_QoI]